MNDIAIPRTTSRQRALAREHADTIPIPVETMGDILDRVRQERLALDNEPIVPMLERPTSDDRNARPGTVSGSDSEI